MAGIGIALVNGRYLVNSPIRRCVSRVCCCCCCCWCCCLVAVAGGRWQVAVSLVRDRGSICLPGPLPHHDSRAGLLFAPQLGACSASPHLPPPFSLHAIPTGPANRAVMAGFLSRGAGLAVSASALVPNLHLTAKCERSDTSKFSFSPRPTGTLQSQVSIHPCASDLVLPSPRRRCRLHPFHSQNLLPLPRTARQAILHHTLPGTYYP